MGYFFRLVQAEGTVVVHAESKSSGVALYARVSSADPKNDLDRQLVRLTEYAIGNKLVIVDGISRRLNAECLNLRFSLFRSDGMASLDERVTELLEQFAQRAEVELEIFVERCIADYQQDCHTKFGLDHVVTEDAMFEFFVDWLCRVVVATIADRFGAELVTQAELAAAGAMKSDLTMQLAPGGLLFPAGDSDEYCAVMFPQHYLQQIALRLAHLGDPEDGVNLLTAELLGPIGAPPLETYAYWDVLRDILSGLADRTPVKYMATSRRVEQSAPVGVP